MNFLMQKFQQNELDELSDKTNLVEIIDYGCHFIVAKDEDGKIIGVVGFNLESEKYPRFEHIIIAPEYQKTGLAVRLMREMENYFFNYMNERCYVSYIQNNNERMISLAKRWGLKPFQEHRYGSWWVKIGGRKHLLKS